MTALSSALETPYRSYVYAYPHKTAYRPIDPPTPLEALWAGEARGALFLYLHVPFCEMRCGFCNLFTTAHPQDDLVTAYLAALERQAGRVAAALGEAAFARMAIGGGTPTYLAAGELARLFDLVTARFGVDPTAIPVSVETSPHTATADRLALLRRRGVDRISIGVQSFVESEVRAAGRPQRSAEVHAALERIRSAGFPTLNVDLIYGLPGQSVDSWLVSLREALRYRPEELYLYPLYVRPLTGLGRRDLSWDDDRLACYRAGRDFLIAAGYTQLSMRMFRAQGAAAVDGPVYCCQEDGMVGLGCGARSYTRGLHYASEYAVGRRGVLEILADYVAQSEASFAAVDYGFILDGDEQRRRYLIKSLLRAEGLSLAGYQAWFGTQALEDFPDLAELQALGLAMRRNGTLRLTAAGLALSDAIGPWFYSPRVRALTESYDLR